MLPNVHRLASSLGLRSTFASLVAAGVSAVVLLAQVGVARAATQSPGPSVTAPTSAPSAMATLSPSAASKYGATNCANPALPRAILAAPPAVSSPPPLKTETVVAPNAHLVLAIAATDPVRELGLMCVTKLKAHAGMIFAFARDDTVEFWMKHTLIPLDMVWLDTSGRVTTVASHVPAATLETADADVARRSGVGRYVVELNSGEAAKDGIKTGIRLKLPK
jgi:uncharacterized membrane protein (UPF0127 family)